MVIRIMSVIFFVLRFEEMKHFVCNVKTSEYVYGGKENC